MNKENLKPCMNEMCVLRDLDDCKYNRVKEDCQLYRPKNKKLSHYMHGKTIKEDCEDCDSINKMVKNTKS